MTPPSAGHGSSTETAEKVQPPSAGHGSSTETAEEVQPPSAGHGSSTETADEVPASEDDRMSDVAVKASDTGAMADVETTSLSSVQSMVRQTLARMNGLTYTITDVAFLQDSLSSLRQQAEQFHQHCDIRRPSVLFRQGRRMVKLSIDRSRLRRRLSAIRAKRIARKRRH